MKKLPIIVILVAAAAFYYYRTSVKPAPGVEKESNAGIVGNSSSSGDAVLDRAFRNKISDIQVNGSGRVLKILSDDSEGSRHQRFILKLDSGQTLLVAHNIDLAPRIESLRVGDTVDFYGEYEWNSQGGVIHWTHSDPPGGSSHKDGWLKHKGRVYD